MTPIDANWFAAAVDWFAAAVCIGIGLLGGICTSLILISCALYDIRNELRRHNDA